MSQDQSSRSTALWDQLLQRISGTEEHEYDFFKIELLELVADNLTNTDHFFTRFGTVLNRCLRAPVVLVRRGSDSTVLYSNTSLKLQKKVSASVTLSKTAAFTLVEQKLRDPITYSRAGSLHQTYRLPLEFDNGWVEVLIATDHPMLLEQKKFLNYVSLLLGIRRRRQLLQNQLTQEQQRLSALTHHLSEGLAVLNSELIVTIWNRPLHQLTGCSHKDVIGRPIEHFLPKVGGGNWLRELIALNSNSTGRSVFHSDVHLETKRNETEWVNVSGSVIRNQEGEISQVIVLVRDITHLKELEQRKNEFISIATHELRTPITAIKGYLSLLKKEASSFTEKQQTYLDRATDASERLVRLAEDLLHVVRVEENRVKFSCRRTNLGALLTKVCRDFSEKADQKGVDLRVTKPAASTFVNIDRIRTEQLFSNLIDNAIKYTRRGSVQASLRIDKLSGDKPWAIVDIMDSGIGIETKELNGIFEKFHRTPSASSSRESGVGLGLYIVKSFVEMQHGRITVRSQPKKGSTFTVSFPIVKHKKGGAK